MIDDRPVRFVLDRLENERHTSSRNVRTDGVVVSQKRRDKNRRVSFTVIIADESEGEDWKASKMNSKRVPKLENIRVT